MQIHMKRVCTLLLILLTALFPAASQRFQAPSLPKGYDEIWVLCVGNSFSYYHDCDIMLKDIAASQGLSIRIGKYFKGGQTFGQHLKLQETRKAILAGNYDFALFQDQSVTPAKYSRDGYVQAYDDLVSLKRQVVMRSPDCKVILERTWSYPGKEAGGFGTAEELDKHLEKGTKEMARKAHLWLSPIGNAFNTSRAERPDIKLLGPDDKHQSSEGSYLKSCVNYLVITGKPFSGYVDNCGIDPEAASYLRRVAERTVLGKETKYRIHRDKKELPFLQGPGIVAHRGYHAPDSIPENSRASLAAAIERGFYGSEFDVWLTKDDSLVVNHDKSFRTDPLGRIIKDTPYSELSGIRLDNGETIPSFRDFLKQEQDNQRVKLICELKRHGSDSRNAELFDRCYALAKSMKVENMIVWQTFSFELCKHIVSVDPYARVIYICTKEKDVKTPEEIVAAGLDGVNYSAAIYDAHPGFISEFHKRGLKANLCLQDDPEVWKKYAKTVDLIGTNDPEGLRKILNQR